jgi:hypothetical protein
VIERNTPVPIEQTRTFTTFQDDQESVQIRVYQGESRVANENELLGQFEFSGFRKARRGEVAIDVTFEINADGIVNVTARDQETGKQSSTSITLSSGLSENELKSIIEEARTDRVQTASPGGETVAQRAEPAPAVPALPPAPPAAPRAAVERRAPPARTAPTPPPVAVRSAPQPVPRPVAAAQKTPQPEPEPDLTEPQLETAAPAKLAPDETPTDEHLVFEELAGSGSDLAPDPVDDSLDLLGDSDLAALQPEIDLVDEGPAPAAEEAPGGLFDAPGTDLSTLPDPDARKKS